MNISEKAERYRGLIIHATITMEKAMDTYISNYFCSDKTKTQEMHYLFLGDNRINLENKRQIFIWLAKNHDQDLLKKYVSIRGEMNKNNSLDKDMIFVIEQRNIFAHLLVDVYKSEDDILHFVKFKNSRKTFGFTDIDFLQLQQVITDISVLIFGRLNWLTDSLGSPLLDMDGDFLPLD